MRNELRPIYLGAMTIWSLAASWNEIYAEIIFFWKKVNLFIYTWESSQS